MFGKPYSPTEARRALSACNVELGRMHILLHKANSFDLDDCRVLEDRIEKIKERADLMERIIKLQDTLLEGTRRLCGLEY